MKNGRNVNVIFLKVFLLQSSKETGQDTFQIAI